MQTAQPQDSLSNPTQDKQMEMLWNCIFLFNGQNMPFFYGLISTIWKIHEEDL